MDDYQREARILAGGFEKGMTAFGESIRRGLVEIAKALTPPEAPTPEAPTPEAPTPEPLLPDPVRVDDARCKIHSGFVGTWEPHHWRDSDRSVFWCER